MINRYVKLPDILRQIASVTDGFLVHDTDDPSFINSQQQLELKHTKLRLAR